MNAPTFLLHPEFPTFLEAALLRGCHAEFADWLNDHEATTADAVRLFAVVPNPRLRDWPTPSATDCRLQKTLACWEDGCGNAARAATIRELHVVRKRRWWVTSDDTDVRMYGDLCASETAAKMRLKRRILGLFDGDFLLLCPRCGGAGNQMGIRCGCGSGMVLPSNFLIDGFPHPRFKSL